MDRDLEIVREAASALGGDLNRALPLSAGWRIEVSEDFVVAVTTEDQHELVAISAEVEDPDWYDVGGSPEERREALWCDAAEALAHEVFEVLYLWGQPGPRCALHQDDLGVCTGVWICAAEHDVCPVGELDSAHVVQPPMSTP